MDRKTVSIPVQLDETSLRAFAAFDNFERQRYWIMLLVFSVVLLVFSAVFFAMSSVISYAALFGILLIVLALGIPLTYVLVFRHIVAKQVKSLDAQHPVISYTVTLSNQPDGISMTGRGGRMGPGKWEDVTGAYWGKGHSYLYADKQGVVIIPDTDAGAQFDSMWGIITEMLPAEKVHCKK